MKKLRITVGNKSYEVTVEDLTGPDAFPPPVAAPPSAAETSGSPSGAVMPGPAAARPRLPAEAGAVTSPMAGVIKSILVKDGDSVTKGQSLVILEAMKMENAITAPVAGTVTRLGIAAGDSVDEGHVLLILE